MAINLHGILFVKIVSSLRRRACGSKDRPVVGFEHFQSAGEVASVIRARGGGKAKVAAEEG